MRLTSSNATRHELVPAPRESREETLIAESGCMRELLARVNLLARLDVPVLVCGETGVGKELIAARLHQFGPRHGAPYVALNCAALSDGVLESELFGHRRGAFTGAERNHVGAFEAAHRGTVFLDEVGELSAKAQASLLRVIQERAIRRIGETQHRSTDFRLIAATHRDLAQAVESGSFREDLYFRLNTIPLRIPALRERHEDLVALTRHFVRRYARRFGWPVPNMSPECLTVLSRRRWPGNVRELEGAVVRALVASQGARALNADDFELRRERDSAQGSLFEATHAFERSLLTQTLARHRGNRTETARALKISRQCLHQKLRRYGLSSAPRKRGVHGPGGKG